jgi:hypothetical protein
MLTFFMYRQLSRVNAQTVFNPLTVNQLRDKVCWVRSHWYRFSVDCSDFGLRSDQTDIEKTDNPINL